MSKTLGVQRILPGRILILGTFLLLLLLLLLLLPFTNAQTTSPPPTTNGEYATVNNTFYIQGGSLSLDGTQLTPAIFSLDLTVPWNDQSPPWVTLPIAGSGAAPLTYQQSMTPTGDKTQMVIWNVQRYQMTNFQLTNHAWGPTQTYSANNINWGGLKAVIPPTASGTLGVLYMVKPKKRSRRMGGLVFFCSCLFATQINHRPVVFFFFFFFCVWQPNGCWNLSQVVNPGTSLCTVNLDTQAWVQTPMPAGYLPIDVSYYSFVYSTLRKSMVMYGGTSMSKNGPSPFLYEYLPATKTWSFLVGVFL